jgi:hypothetical protein
VPFAFAEDDVARDDFYGRARVDDALPAGRTQVDLNAYGFE